MTYQKTVAIDFDGVIHAYTKGWQGGELYDPPVPGTKAAIQRLIMHGWRVVIYTTRNNPLYHKGAKGYDLSVAIENYLNEYEIPYSEVHFGGKPIAQVYLDDRAVCFDGNWNNAVSAIQNFKTYQEK